MQMEYYLYLIYLMKSFDDLDSWYEFYINEKGDEKINGVILGNKSDLNRQVSYEDAQKFADEKGLEYFETSAKLDKGIKKAIVSLLEEITESKTLYNSLRSVNSLKSEKSTDTEIGTNSIRLVPKGVRLQSVVKFLPLVGIVEHIVPGIPYFLDIAETGPFLPV